jgi:hypothetical protein
MPNCLPLSLSVGNHKISARTLATAELIQTKQRRLRSERVHNVLLGEDIALDLMKFVAMTTGYGSK